MGQPQISRNKRKIRKINRRVHKISDQRKYDKYDLYRKAVQSPESDVEFLRDVYVELRKKKPIALREDFSGTFLIACAWLKLNKNHKAIAVDLDPEPLEYGKIFHFPSLKEEQKKRLTIKEMNVLANGLPKADIVCAMNFSYFVLKSRALMKAYFKNVFGSLNQNGVFVLDLFGGSLCQNSNEEKTKLKGFTYYWHQESFDPVTQYAKFNIHFRIKGQPREERVFSYDWRMWTIPELRELLEEVGFKKTHVYWEGTTRKGEGDGQFRRTEKGEACEAWIAYIAAEK
jgi:hypothetical protein